jgi:hypothetical protein
MGDSIVRVPAKPRVSAPYGSNVRSSYRPSDAVRDIYAGAGRTKANARKPEKVYGPPADRASRERKLIAPVRMGDF